MLLRDHRGLAHAGHHRNHLLDLGRRDVFAADLEHVLGAVAEPDKTVLQQRDAVAGDEIAVLVLSRVAFSLCRYSENSDRPGMPLIRRLPVPPTSVGVPSSSTMRI